MNIQHYPYTPPVDPEQEKLRIERRAARQARRRQKRRTQFILGGTIGLSAILLGLIGFFYVQIQTITSINAANPPINGITCDPAENFTYHIHAHLSIYINGKPVTIPAKIGIASDGSCFYWMHTHTGDGIIHIEAPQKAHNEALDDFLTVWHIGFSSLNFPPELTLSTGWSIYVNGTPFKGAVTSPLSTEVPLSSHDVVTMEYGKPTVPAEKFYQFPPSLPT